MSFENALAQFCKKENLNSKNFKEKILTLEGAKNGREKPAQNTPSPSRNPYG